MNTVPETTGVHGECSEKADGQFLDDDGPLSARYDL